MLKLLPNMLTVISLDCGILLGLQLVILTTWKMLNVSSLGLNYTRPSEYQYYLLKYVHVHHYYAIHRQWKGDWGTKAPAHFKSLSLDLIFYHRKFSSQLIRVYLPSPLMPILLLLTTYMLFGISLIFCLLCLFLCFLDIDYADDISCFLIVKIYSKWP